ncbi:MAG: EF-hand domain-containing protein [Proteobacteria bacterium]|nr:EF-hand domain-containing protein [Pseudomonadota bacterium]
MSQSSKKPVALAVGTALVGGLMLSGTSFAITPLAQGYLLGAQDAAQAADAKAKEGSCGGDKAKAEGKCGEGKCGIDKVDTDKDGKVSRAEFDAVHPNEAEKFAAMDSNGDGFIDQAEHDAHKAAKKADGEGKCGEGKCGEGKCGGAA